jgi:ferredoxin
VLRKIIHIDEEKCDGCGVCVPACPEGALEVIDGKARLVSEIYCDGLGACLGECPRGAITVEEREAADFDEAAVRERLAEKVEDEAANARKAEREEPKAPPFPASGGCPGAALRMLGSKNEVVRDPSAAQQESALRQWPVQLMLVPPFAPFLKESDLLICADCVPFALPDFHARYLQGRALLVGCPKLDDLGFYREKLRNIFEVAKPKSLTVLRMEVPCCGGIAVAAIEARNEACPELPVEVHTIGIEGGIHKENTPAGALAKS